MKSIFLFVCVLIACTANAQGLQPKKLANLNQQNIGSMPAYYTVLNDKLFFCAGSAIYITDGIKASTRMFVDFPPQIAGDVNSVVILDTVDNKLLFVKTSASVPLGELWTVSLLDTVPHKIYSITANDGLNENIGRMMGNIVFKSSGGYQYSTSDGSVSGTSLLQKIKNLNPIIPYNFLNFKDSCYYIDYKTTRYTILTTLGKDNTTAQWFGAGSPYAAANVYRMQTHGDQLYFQTDSLIVRYDYNTKAFKKLLRQDYIQQFKVIGKDSLVFIGRAKGLNFGLKLYVNDSIIPLYNDITVDSTVTVSEFVRSNNHFGFVINSVQKAWRNSFWVADVAGRKCQFIDSFLPDAYLSVIKPTVFNGKFYYNSLRPGGINTKSYLKAYDPLQNTLADAIDFAYGSIWYSGDFRVYNNQMFGTVMTDTTGYEPYYVHGNGSLHLLKDLVVADNSSYPGNYVNTKDYVLFNGTDNYHLHHKKIYRTNKKTLVIDTIDLGFTTSIFPLVKYNQNSVNDSFLYVNFYNYDDNQQHVLAMNYYTKVVKRVNDSTQQFECIFAGKLNNQSIMVRKNLKYVETIFSTSDGFNLESLLTDNRQIEEIGQAIVHKNRLLFFVKFKYIDSFDLLVTDGTKAGTFLYNKTAKKGTQFFANPQLLKGIGDDIYYTGKNGMNTLWKLTGTDMKKEQIPSNFWLNANDTGYVVNGQPVFMLNTSTGYNFYSLNLQDTVLKTIKKIYDSTIVNVSISTPLVHQGRIYFVAFLMELVGANYINYSDILSSDLTESGTKRLRRIHESSFNPVRLHGFANNYLVYSHRDSLLLTNNQETKHFIILNGIVQDAWAVTVADSLVFFSAEYDSTGVEPYCLYAPITKNYFTPTKVKQVLVNNYNLQLYPNPGSQQVHLKSSIKQFTEYAICDFNGRELIHVKLDNPLAETEINLQGLSKGVYFVRVMFVGGGYGVVKFIKG
ncbi:MAG: T9SS type A sorting domain-containing protein [Bacteroidota bacterium]